MADPDREEWLRESLEALPVAVPIGGVTKAYLVTAAGMELTYDPTPAPPTPFAEGVTKGYLVWRMPDRSLIADCVVMVDSEGMTQYEQTSDWRPTAIAEDE